VDLLDIKEPARGSLGRAEDHVIAEVVHCVAGQVPLSAALGELREANPIGRLPPGISFAKLGLAGCRSWANWSARWRTSLDGLPCGVTPVAVGYADWRTCDAPCPEEVLVHGAHFGCGAALLDTYDKSAGGVFDHRSLAELAQWIAEAHRLDMLAVIAGSLSVQTAAQAAALGPDYIAVRGAACRGGRSGLLEPQRIVAIRRRLQGASCWAPSGERLTTAQRLPRKQLDSPITKAIHG
jgi:uncharacterized protein (UPF0264 family)